MLGALLPSLPAPGIVDSIGVEGGGGGGGKATMLVDIWSLILWGGGQDKTGDDKEGDDNCGNGAAMSCHGATIDIYGIFCGIFLIPTHKNAG